MPVIELHRIDPDENQQEAAPGRDAIEPEAATTARATETLAAAADLGAALRRALEAAHPSAGRFIVVTMPADAHAAEGRPAEPLRQTQAKPVASGVRERLAGILAADMAGYTRLMAADEHGTLAALEGARLVFRSCIEAHAGRIVDMAGDSVLATFETATGALRAALAAQVRLRADAASLATNRRVQFRVGVHVGDIIEKTDGTVYGDGINIAARLQALADPTEVWVSDSARGAIGGRVAASYEIRGRRRVKDAGRTVLAYRATDAAASTAGS